MDAEFQEFFVKQWNKYFTCAGLPVCFYYTDQVREEDLNTSLNVERCLIGNLQRVQEGYPFVYHAHLSGCSGGKRYSGFSKNLRSKFEYFLSCGIPGELEGERYKKSPELVEEYLKSHPAFEAPGKYLVFKRLDKLAENEEPFAAIFFASPDVLAGLFTLANYDRADPYGVISPMGSGCASIINYPIEEAQSEQPRCVLGMFDVSARPHVEAGKMTFAMPMRRLEQMALNIEESFLITKSWELVRERVKSE